MPGVQLSGRTDPHRSRSAILSKWRRLILGAALVGLLIKPENIIDDAALSVDDDVERCAQQPQVMQVGNVEPQDNTDAEFMATQLGLLQSRLLA